MYNLKKTAFRINNFNFNFISIFSSNYFCETLAKQEENFNYLSNNKLHTEFDVKIQT